jgi:hypothetical protein
MRAQTDKVCDEVDKGHIYSNQVYLDSRDHNYGHVGGL